MNDDGLPFGEIANRTARLLRRLADQRLAPFDLAAGYLPVLTALMEGKAMSQKALTEHAGIEQPTMAATLMRMERDGAIERQPIPGDRRSVSFMLSARTLSRRSEIEAAIRDLNVDALAGLSPADQAKLRRMLAAVAASVQDLLATGPEQGPAT